MRSLLAPLGAAYSGISQLRSLLYEREIFNSAKLDKPTISVGNLTVGGTGKTPVVDFILSQAEEDGLKGCVLTRGYGRQGLTNAVVSPQDRAVDVGDEPFWLAKRHPRSSVVVGSDRLASVDLVKNVDFYILDDGLQHLQVQRDLDVVCLDCSRPLWHYRPLPWGYAREPFSALSRGDIVLLTRANLVDPEIVERLRENVALCGITKIFVADLKVKGVVEIESQKEISLKSERIFLVSGIANPESFEDIAKTQGEIVGHRIFPDHYLYTSETLKTVAEEAKRHNATVVLTTEKDAVKWAKPIPMKAAQLLTELEFKPSLPKLYDLASQRLR